MRTQRIGKFRVNRMFLELDNLCARRLMERVLILRADYVDYMHSVEYFALCDAFDENPECNVVPEYEVQFWNDPIQVRFKRLSGSAGGSKGG